MTMTDRQHPITPPPELVQQWRSELPTGIYDGYKYTDREKSLCVVAAQWGADQELEACCEWLDDYLLAPKSGQLRTARRPEPKPPSLKEKALQALELLQQRTTDPNIVEPLRRALEQLDD
jgi:hypothetical protein